MKTLKTTITCTLILTAIMSLLSCHDLPASNYQRAFMAWIGSGILTDTPADPDEDIHAGKEEITITGYVMDNNISILGLDGKKYTAVSSEQDVDGFLYVFRRVVAKAVIADASPDPAAPVPVIIKSIRIDSSGADVIIRGRVIGATGTRVAITGDDGRSYAAEAPVEYISMLGTADFWDVFVQARIIENACCTTEGAIPITIVYCKLDSDAIVSKTGSVQYNTLEGGFWCILGDDGRGYDVNNLPEELHVEGLRVKFTAKMSDRCAAYHMWGFCIELADIEPLL